jgi:hypothetical protein
MIKVKNNTATREAIPAFLQGLAQESLADLSWTDPALGVSDAAWWPEVDQSPALQRHERYDAETLTIDADNQQVIVVRSVVPWTQAEIDAETAGQAAQVRAERNGLLTASDWTQGKDIADAVSTPWATYRQALRDISDQAGFPWTVTWPEMP